MSKLPLVLLGNLRDNRTDSGRCEQQLDAPDWYNRYGFLTSRL